MPLNLPFTAQRPAALIYGLAESLASLSVSDDA